MEQFFEDEPLDVVFVRANEAEIKAALQAGVSWCIRIVRHGQYLMRSPTPSGDILVRSGAIGRPPDTQRASAETVYDACFIMRVQVASQGWCYDPDLYGRNEYFRRSALPPRTPPVPPAPPSDPYFTLKEQAIIAIGNAAQHYSTDADALIEILAHDSWTRLDVGDAESVRQGVAGAKRVNFYKRGKERSYYGVAVQWSDDLWTFTTVWVSPGDRIHGQDSPFRSVR